MTTTPPPVRPGAAARTGDRAGAAPAGGPDPRDARIAALERRVVQLRRERDALLTVVTDAALAAGDDAEAAAHLADELRASADRADAALRPAGRRRRR
jgi:hypothetical protein